jgi:hypothetical protein
MRLEPFCGDVPVRGLEPGAIATCDVLYSGLELYPATSRLWPKAVSGLELYPATSRLWPKAVSGLELYPATSRFWPKAVSGLDETGELDSSPILILSSLKTAKKVDE